MRKFASRGDFPNLKHLLEKHAVDKTTEEDGTVTIRPEEVRAPFSTCERAAKPKGLSKRFCAGAGFRAGGGREEDGRGGHP